MPKIAVVTGAGSGVGQAVALQLAKEGWQVALLGRRPDALQQTLKLAGENASQLLPIPCDVASFEQVAKAAKTIDEKLGVAEVLVAAAGINIPKRSWEVLGEADFRSVIDANLTGVFNCVHAFLPGMRKAGNGTIVPIVSDAALQASAKAGAAYVASKFGLRGMCQSINAEERANGIRCTALLPGDINTPILDKRPVPPPPEARVKMLQPEDVAACVMLAINLPPRAIIEELLIRPR